MSGHSRYTAPMEHNFTTLLGVFGISLAVTLGAWGAVFGTMGVLALWKVINLTILEITFSFDNAVVNAKWLKTLNHFWQTIFMTVGIFIAVFVVRFVLPIFIVMVTTGEGFTHVIDLALNNPALYAEELHGAGPFIDAFGGTFLVMIALNYFLDAEKETHWLAPIERRLAPLGRFDNLSTWIAIMFQIVTFALHHNAGVLMAGICGVALYEALDLFDSAMDQDTDDDEDTASVPEPSPVRGVLDLQQKAGMAAFIVFLRLEILDASFSFDGVIGAFALTTSVFLIMAGLGSGAMWVRSLTVYLVRAGTMDNFRYLEAGAHWAIGVLGGTMLFKLYGLSLPEAVVGSIGLVFIAFALVSSIRANRRDALTAA